VNLKEIRETGAEHRYENLKVTDQFSDLDIDGIIIFKPLLREKDLDIWT
jgi:hypothetical protein